MPSNEYIKRSDAVFALCGDCLGTEACGMIGTPCDEVEKIKTIPAADVEPKQKWIPVTEGLPENFVEVLVTDGENVGIAALQGFMDDEVVWCNVYGMDYIDDPDDEDYLPITHWMPLPEPPEEV